MSCNKYKPVINNFEQSNFELQFICAFFDDSVQKFYSDFLMNAA